MPLMPFSTHFKPMGKQSFVGGYARLGMGIMSDKGIGKQVKGTYERITRELAIPLK